MAGRGTKANRTMTALAILVALASQTATTVPAETYPGRCEYSEQLRQYLGSTEFAICDNFTLLHHGNLMRFSFGDRRSGEATVFEGRMDGDVMQVERIVLASGRALPVTGTCKTFKRDEILSVASCVVRSRTRGYAANFVRSRTD